MYQIWIVFDFDIAADKLTWTAQKWIFPEGIEPPAKALESSSVRIKLQRMAAEHHLEPVETLLPDWKVPFGMVFDANGRPL